MCGMSKHSNRKTWTYTVLFYTSTSVSCSVLGILNVAVNSSDLCHIGFVVYTVQLHSGVSLHVGRCDSSRHVTLVFMCPFDSSAFISENIFVSH